ncbi:hypothetical protein ACLOJK_036567 [Asimina triloba]
MKVQDLQMPLSTSFTNLKILELVMEESEIVELEAIAYLGLVLCCIAELSFEKVGKDGGNRESKCQLYNLKEVEMRGFEGRDFELDLIELLFKSAIVLERMTLIAPQLDLQSARRSA